MSRNKQVSVGGTVVNDWLSSILRRLNNNLPHKVNAYSSSQEKAVNESMTGLLELSAYHFVPVVEGIMKLMENIQQIAPPSSADEHALQSYLVLLQALTDILNHKSSGLPEDVPVLERLSHKVWQLCTLEGEKLSKLSEAAAGVLDPLSRLHFATLYTTKIVLKLTSPVGLGSATDESMWQLIPSLNLNGARLVSVLSVANTCLLRNQKRQRLLPSIVHPLKQAALKFIREYTLELNHLASDPNSKLSQQADMLFEQAEGYSDNAKKKSTVWPLQNIMLMLCPNILKKIAAGSTSDDLKNKLAFFRSLQKAVSTRQHSDMAALCCVDTATICSMVDPKETTVYRYYVTAIQAQLQDILFSGKDLFLHTPASVVAGVPLFADLDLMVDCFVSHYRINHRNNHLTHVCLDPAAPTALKLVLARSVLELLSVQTPLSWWPHPDTLHHLGTSLRTLFQDELNVLRKNDPALLSAVDAKAFWQHPASAAALLGSRSKSERRALVEALLDYELTRVLINIFISAPELVFAGENNSKGQDSLRLMTTLAGLVQHPGMPELALRASQTLLSLHKPEHMSLWQEHTTLKSFFDISCQVTFTLAMRLISRKTTDSSQLLLWFKEILHYRSLFLQEHKDEATLDREDNRFFSKTQNMVEVVMLTYLHSPEVQQTQLALSCFDYLVREAEVLATAEDSAGSLVPYALNVEAYRELSRMSREKLIGRAAQQKKIYAVLKRIVCTDGSAMAWDDSYNTWRSLTAVLTSYQKEEPQPAPDLLKVPLEQYLRNTIQTRTIKRSSTVPSNASELSDDALQSTLTEWSNITGFLCAAGGVAIRQAEATRSHQRISFSPLPAQSPPATADTMSPRGGGPRRSNSYAGERRYRTHRRQASNGSNGSSDKERGQERDRCDSDPQPTTNPDTFVTELLGLLKCDNEAIGGQICEAVRDMVGYELSPLLYGALFSSLKHHLRALFEGGGAGAALVTPLNTRFVDQVASIVQHILERRAEENADHWTQIRLEDSVPALVKYAHQLDMTEYSVSVRMKLCQLLELIAAHTQELAFYQEVHFRNEMVAMVTQWMQGPNLSVDADEGVALRSHDVMLLDLNLSSLKAVACLLTDLPLQPEARESDFMEQKTKLFKKYYTLFLSVLGNLEEDGASLPGVDDKQALPRSSSQSFRQKQLARHVSAAKATTIQAMSNLLVANIDSGLSHAIALGYHGDLITRSSFVESLAAILKQGAEFNSLAHTALADCYNEMLQLIGVQTDNGEFPVIMLLADTVPLESLDEVARLCIMACDHLKILEPFLTKVLVTEVEALLRGQIDVIFRGNSLPCKVLSQSFRSFGLFFLQSVVRPIVVDLLQDRGRHYEVDPAREPDQDTIAENQQNLVSLTTQFLTRLAASVDLLPPQVQTVCRSLYKVLQTHYPGKAEDMLSSTVFLRFINPALVAPQHFGLLVPGEVPPSGQRGMKLMSKILQNLANHLPFKKEGHMMSFNWFLEENFHCTRKIAIAMATGSSSETDNLESIVSLKDPDRYSFHLLLWEHIDQMISTASTTRTLVDKGPLMQLNSVLHRLGAPSEQQRRVVRRNTIAKNILEDYLLQTSRKIDKQALKEIRAEDVLYMMGYSKAGNPVFCLVLRKFQSDSPGFAEKMVYHVLATLNSYSEHSFELLLDLTAMTERNMPNSDIMVKFAVYVPELTMSHLETVYLYNCNPTFRALANRIPVRIFSHIKGAKKVLPAENWQKLFEYLDPSVLSLPLPSVNYESLPAVMFPSVLIAREKTAKSSASLRVTQEGLVITYADRQQVFGQQVVVKDIYPVSSIKEALVEERKDRLTVRLLSCQQPLLLSTSEPWTPVKAINHVVAKWHVQQASRYMSERELQPSDVPGTFLNIALYSFCSDYPLLRLASYNLICAMKEAFQLQVTGHVLEAHNLCLSEQDMQYVKSVSSELAANEPQMTLEFLTEAIGSLQKAELRQKLFCLAYMSPWLHNLGRFVKGTEGEEEREDGEDKLKNVLKMLVHITLTEAEIMPVLQVEVWSAVGGVSALVGVVLDLFVAEMQKAELGSHRSEVLASTCTSLAAVNQGAWSSSVVQRIMKLLSEMTVGTAPSHPHHSPPWGEVCALVRITLRLSFNNRLDVVEQLSSVLYIVLMLLCSGPVLLRAALHGIVINLVQSLSCQQQIKDNDDVLKGLSLKMVELSHQRIQFAFGIPDVKSTPSVAMASATHFIEILELCSAPLVGEAKWVDQWEHTASTYAFNDQSAHQSRSFVAMAAWSSCKHAQVSLTSSVEILGRFASTVLAYPKKNAIAEAILSCLSCYVSHMTQCNTLLKHLFWVAIATLQVGDPTLYASAQVLLQKCVARLQESGYLDTQTLAEVVMPARIALESYLNKMDSTVGVSFTSNFDFALASVLYRGVCHPVVTVHQRTVTLLGKLFHLHTPRDELGGVEVTEHNLAYLVALFTINDKIKLELSEGRSHGDDSGGTVQSAAVLLLNNNVVQSSREIRALLLLMVSSAVIHSEDAARTAVLYRFLNDASEVFRDVYPIIFSVLKSNMSQQLGSSHNPQTVAAVQGLVRAAMRPEGSLPDPFSIIQDLGFCGLINVTAPFSKADDMVVLSHNASLLYKYLVSLTTKLGDHDNRIERKQTSV